MEKAAEAQELRQAFATHCEEMQGQIERLEQVAHAGSNKMGCRSAALDQRETQ